MDRSRSSLPPNYSHFLVGSKHIDVSSIKGNMSDDLKRFGQAGLDFFVSTEDKSYGANTGKRLKLMEMNVSGEGGMSYVETICFITIDKGILLFHFTQKFRYSC
jgi:hypothetical protein